MTKSQERTLSMFLLVINYLKTNFTILTMIPKFTQIFEIFETIVNEIISIEQLRIGSDIKIQTNTKKDMRAQCTVQLQNIIDMLRAYSIAVDDNVLLQKTSALIYLIKKASDTTFFAECNKYYAIAEPLTVNLAPYGIDAAYMAAFRQNIDKYTDIITNPRTAIINRADGTAQLKVLFANAKKELDKLTILVTTKRFTEPRLYTKYIESIRVIDNGNTLQVLHVVLKAENDTPLRGFTFTFTHKAEGKVSKYKTNENGTIIRGHFKEGIYDVTITKIGYTPITTTITLENTTTYKLNVMAHTVDKTISIV